MKSLCIYCGAKAGDKEIYLQTAKSLGVEAAKQGWRLVYGGGSLGLMGATAGAARDAGGDVYGIIPEFLVELEGILDGVNHKIVQTMHERKKLMFDAADVIVTLPGGIGTLEEVVETVSWARLQLHRKPIILFNIDGYWTPLKKLFDHVVDAGFADEGLRSDIVLVDNITDLFKIANARTHGELV